MHPETGRPAEPRRQSGDQEAREDQPLLQPPEEDAWKAPRGFVWIQLAIMGNVFLNAFDGTITASTYAVIGSEFDAANTASWLTTSYLLTSTAVQPLYGRVSDIFGRRICLFISTATFALGCLGCGIARDIITLNCMRALTGIGGGGLMTMGKNKTLRRSMSDMGFSVDAILSYYCQFGHDTISQTRHVPGHAEWHLWPGSHVRCLSWRCHR